jgi:hypothetical protein
VTEEVPYRDALFALLRELRPIFGDRIVVVDPALVHERQHERGHDTFGRRIRHRQRIGLPRLAALIARASPGVDHALPPVVNANGCTSRPGPAELPRQLIGHRPEILVDVASDHGRDFGLVSAHYGFFGTTWSSPRHRLSAFRPGGPQATSRRSVPTSAPASNRWLLDRNSAFTTVVVTVLNK